MPKGQIIKRENIKLVKKMSIVISIILIVSIIMDFAVLAFKFGYNRQVAIQGKEINKLSIAERYKAAYDIIGKKLIYRESILDKIDSSNGRTTKLINAIEETIPSDINLSNLSLDKDDHVTLEGTGDNTDTILDFYHGLKASGISDYITFNSFKGTIGDTKGIDFMFSFILGNGKWCTWVI